jgi:hypothetical protein
MSVKSKAFALFTTCSILAGSLLPTVSQATQTKVLVNSQNNLIAQNEIVPQFTQSQLDLSKLKIKLVKKNKDGSETYTVNGKKITVTKKQIQQTYQVYVKNNNGKGVNIQFLPQMGTLTAAVLTMQAFAQTWGYTAGLFIANACAVRPDNCAKTLMGVYQGAGWAKSQIVQWSKGRY